MLIVGIGVAKDGRIFTGALGAAQAGVVFRGLFSSSKPEERSPSPKREKGSSSKARLSSEATDLFFFMTSCTHSAWHRAIAGGAVVPDPRGGIAVRAEVA